MTDMRTTGLMVAGVSLLLTATACSSGGAKVRVEDSPTPGLSVSATPDQASAAAGAHRVAATHAATTTSSPSSRPSAAPTPAATHSTASVAPKPARSATTTKATTCGGSGSTTTIQMVTGDRFTPSAVTINRCDAVKAVYADTTGIPHNWQGHGWTSPDMTSAGQSYTYRFTSTGTFNFFCSYHQGVGMTGTVTVR